MNQNKVARVLGTSRPSAPILTEPLEGTTALKSCATDAGRIRVGMFGGPHVEDFAEGRADPLCTECPPAGVGTRALLKNQAALRALSHATR
jgi:hypothetical protein